MENQSAAKTILDQIEQDHQNQFNLAVGAALKRGFGRWFDDVWEDARAAGALPKPFISSMFVFVTTVLTKKFVNGLPDTMPLEEKEQAIMEANKVLKTYLDQIEASAIKELYQPKPATTHAEPVTPEGNGGSVKKSKLILPKKRKFIQ